MKRREVGKPRLLQEFNQVEIVIERRFHVLRFEISQIYGAQLNRRIYFELFAFAHIRVDEVSCIFGLGECTVAR
ncbi:hypothetical protein DTW90_18525 [Neorhizobium sp. P12A]|nr:hypothetical protein DTW90_18525 [Neorhizobium sp. P12A]